MGATGSTVRSLDRAPILTAVLAIVTAVISVAGLVWPQVLASLQRTPAGLHGESWRWLTSLLVQDGGLFGTVSNLIFLVGLGVAAEQVMSRSAMITAYLVAGLAGQAAGYVWQPIGGGNSVAVCGLAGALAWRLTDPRLPRWTGTALALWLGALLATWWTPLIAVGLLGAVVDRWLTPRLRQRVLLVASAAVAAVLVAAANVHGVALGVGLLAGLLPAVRVRAR